MKRWFKRIGWFLGSLFLLIVVFLAFEHIRGRRQLNWHLQQLRNRGEVLSVSELAPKRLSRQENAAVDLVALTNRSGDLKTLLDQAPPYMRFAAPGKMVVSWRLTQWQPDRKTTNTWAQLNGWGDQSRELLGLIHEAVQKPGYDAGWNFRSGFLDFQTPQAMITAKQVAQVLNLATVYDLHKGRLDAAGEHACDIAMLVALQTPEPMLISQLVRQACAAIAFIDTWQALQAQGWREAQLAALQSAWARCDFISDMVRALEMERAMTLDHFSLLKSSRQKMVAYASGQGKLREEFLDDTSVPHEFMLKWIYIPAWQLAWADQDEAYALGRWETAIQRMRVAQTNSWEALRDRVNGEQDESFMPYLVAFKAPEDLNWYDRIRFLISSEPFSIGDSMIRRTLSIQAQQQMTITVIALKRYELRNGKLPASLEVMVPDFLSALPRDPMDGKPLRYRVLPGSGFVLYSVGEDGKDDGGNSSLRGSKEEYKQIWDGLDAVWPTAATDEEASSNAKRLRR